MRRLHISPLDYIFKKFESNRNEQPWLNEIVSKLWPHIHAYTSTVVREEVEKALHDVVNDAFPAAPAVFKVLGQGLTSTAKRLTSAAAAPGRMLFRKARSSDNVLGRAAAPEKPSGLRSSSTDDVLATATASTARKRRVRIKEFDIGNRVRDHGCINDDVQCSVHQKSSFPSFDDSSSCFPSSDLTGLTPPKIGPILSQCAKDKREIEIDVFLRFDTPEEFAISMEVLGCPIGVDSLNLFGVLSIVMTPLSGDE